MDEYKVVKRLDSWTDILNYFEVLEQDCVLTETRYRTEVFYDDEADQYKVYVFLGKSKV